LLDIVTITPRENEGCGGEVFVHVCHLQHNPLLHDLSNTKSREQINTELQQSSGNKEFTIS
jgi:hypothetical protein